MYSHVVSSLLLMPQMTMGGDASNKEGGRRVVVLNGWLGRADEMGLHCSSQIGMTKIMEIYKAGNIYGRSEGLFRGRVAIRKLCHRLREYAFPRLLLRPRGGRRHVLNGRAKRRCPPTPRHAIAVRPKMAVCTLPAMRTTTIPPPLKKSVCRRRRNERASDS